MLKKIIVVSAAAIISFSSLAYAGQSAPQLSINDEPYIYEKNYERPFISDKGELMASLSIVLAAAGKGSAYFNGINQTVLFYIDGKQITLGIGDTELLVNDKMYEFDTPVTKKYGRVFVPLWVLKSMFQLNVEVQYA